MNLKQLIGETQNVENKKSLSEQKEGLEALCSFVNTDSGKGTVVFGIAPDGTVTGIEPGNIDKAQISLQQKIAQKFDPRIECGIRAGEIDGKRVIVVTGLRPATVPYHEFDGRAFIREGTSRRQLSIQEKRQLDRRRNRDSHNGPWKCDKCQSTATILGQTVRTDKGIKKSYECDCGGEYWPA